jgi:hypothetical protein
LRYGDVETAITPTNEVLKLTAPRHEPASRETIEVVIGVQATGNYIPFWGNSYNACRFQTLYRQSDIAVAGEIVRFAFMPWGSSVGTFDNVRVYLCHTNVVQLSTTFDTNYGGNTPVEVINVPSMNVGNAGNIWMEWDVSFDYNNTDNLLIEIRWNGDNGVGVPIWRTNESAPFRLYAWDDNASTGTVGNQGYYAKLSISTGPAPDHDVGVAAITSPPEGSTPPAVYDVIGQIHNWGLNMETFDINAGVWDTTGGAWTQIFDSTLTLTDFTSGGDTLLNFGP